MNKFSNVLKIPTFSSLYKEIINKIALKSRAIDPNLDVPMFVKKSAERNLEEMMLVENPNPDNLAVTAVYEPGKYVLKSLNEVSSSDQKFVLQLNVLAVYPQPIYDFISVMCKKCQMSCYTKDIQFISSSSSENYKFNCKFCNSDEDAKLYFNVTLVCRENAYSNKLITLHISSYDDEAVNFFGISPVDLYRNSSEYQKLKDIVSKLTQLSSFVSVIVESIKTGHSETDRIYRIIGDYQNNLIS